MVKRGCFPTSEYGKLYPKINSVETRILMEEISHTIGCKANYLIGSNEVQSGAIANSIQNL
jgi:hypothetical protein